MRSPEAEKHYGWGLTLLSQRKFAEATTRFRRAILAERACGVVAPSWHCVSFYALSRALANGVSHDDIRACEYAAARTRFDAKLWRNLAEVYQLAGKKTRALAAIERGLKLDPRDSKLKVMLKLADRRAQPVFPGLGRDHPINRSLGRLRSRRTFRSRAS